MISTTFNGEQVYLLPYRPNWSTKPNATFSLPTTENQSLNGDEARRALAGKLRVSFNFSMFLIGNAESAQFRNGLQALENRRVLCPFWPAAAKLGAGLVYTDGSGNIYVSPGGSLYATSGAATFFQSGIWFTFEPDMSAWEVHTSLNPVGFSPSANAIRVPLMLGYFKNAPTPRPITSKLLTASIDFVESGPADYALTPVAVDGPVGPTVAGGVTHHIFPDSPNWARQQEAGSASVDITRKQIGFGRELAETYYTQNAARSFELTYTKSDWQTIAHIVGFFGFRKGTTESFWIPGPLDECDLTANTSTSSATIHVDDPANLGSNKFLAFVPPSGTVEIRSVSSINTGDKTVTLDAATTVVYRPLDTRIASGILCRFRSPELKLTFTTDAVAEATLSLIETPNEYLARTGETIGSTAGALPTKAYLFRFIRKMPGVDVVDRFTSYESAINVSGEVFTPAKIAHTSITDDLDPEATTVQLQMRAFAGNPVLLMMPNQLEVPLWIQILECTPDALGYASLPRTRFFGRLSKPSFTGPIISVDASSILKQTDRMFPTFLKQKTCNHSVYSVPCGVSKAAYTRTATIGTASGNVLSLTGLSGSAVADHYFSGGKLTFGSGSASQFRSITESTASSSGSLTVTLNRPLTSASGTVSIIPGCKRNADDCKNKFGNYARYGACPFTPNGNPSLVEVTNTAGGGKK